MRKKKELTVYLYFKKSDETEEILNKELTEIKKLDVKKKKSKQ